MCPMELRLLPAAGRNLSEGSFSGGLWLRCKRKTAAEKKKLQMNQDGSVCVVGGYWGPLDPFPSHPGGFPGMLCAVLHPRSSRLSGWVLGVQGAGGASCNAGVMRCAVRPSGAELAWLCFMCNVLGSSPGLRLHKKQTAALKTKKEEESALSLPYTPPPPLPTSSPVWLWLSDCFCSCPLSPWG